MPPTLADRLIHILIAINTIETMLAGKSIETFAADLPLRLGVERSLEIICEASRHLAEDVKSQETTIDWRHMVDFGDLLRHAYHQTDPAMIWRVVHEDLGPLKSFAERVMRDSAS